LKDLNSAVVGFWFRAKQQKQLSPTNYHGSKRKWIQFAQPPYVNGTLVKHKYVDQLSSMNGIDLCSNSACLNFYLSAVFARGIE
jgi:hypothetical protein